MLCTSFLIFMCTWALGLATFQTLGGFIQVILFLALVTLAADMLRERGL